MVKNITDLTITKKTHAEYIWYKWYKYLTVVIF